jgi:D-amino-acid dehydrogenase
MADVLILGAGMVGIGTALALQAQGHRVRVLDRRGPGEETSHGNAGAIQAEARVPYAMPRDPATLIRYALGLSNDVRFSPDALPGAARALLAYFRHSSPSRLAGVVPYYARIISQVAADHGRLIAEADAEALVRRTGLGEIYDDPASFDARRTTALAMAEAHGLKLSLISGEDLRASEPALSAAPAGAVIWHDSWSSSDPSALVRAYARLFEARGGELLRGTVGHLEQAGEGWTVRCAETAHAAEHVVIALGPWSPAILRQLGYRVPMVMKRGYHGHYDMQGTLSRPYFLAQHGVVMASMSRGLRITTGAHLTRETSPRNLTQLKRGALAAGRLVELKGPVTDSQWHGVRPCLPRMLPMVGKAPRHDGLWFNFGHGHQGFTLGPTTGRLLADIFDGRDDDLTRALAPGAV